MVDSLARLLDLLSALQARPEWSGPELADRLGVTVRTVRRDVDRLRALGYAIESDAGVRGGYRLGMGGTAVPPLLLDDDEALALALCVRAAAGDSVIGVGDAAGRALAKVEAGMPKRVRGRLSEIVRATDRMPTRGDEVDADVLMTVSRACRYREALRVVYRNRGGDQTERRLEPFRIVNAGRRWYLVAHDSDAAEWRTFRLDRLLSTDTTGQIFERVDPPNPVEFVRHAITTAPYRYQAVVDFDTPAPDLAALVPPTVGNVEALDENTARLTTGANELDYLAVQIARVGVTFRVREPDLLRQRIGELAERLTAAVSLYDR